MILLANSKDLHELNICIITIPLQSQSGSYYTILNNFLRIISPLVNEVFLITSNFSGDKGSNSRIRILDLNMLPQKRKNIFYKAIYQIIAELKITLSLIRIYRRFDGPIFILSSSLLLPVIAAKFLKKTSILTAVASGSTNARIIYKSAPIYMRYYYCLSNQMLELLTFKLAKYIGVEAPHVAHFMGLPMSKVIGNGHLFFLDENFRPAYNFADRPYCIGYIGRLSREKGVCNFVTAISNITLMCPNLGVIIAGDGPLYSEIKTLFDQGALDNRVQIPGWISHDDLPKYLNQLRLLVLPSYSEGLPNIMLEAMACGTPVLATPVGGVPDVIIDGKTGFIMENNSPECIAENVIRALNSPDLERIAEAGRRFVEENFTFERTVENWKEILQSIE